LSGDTLLSLPLVGSGDHDGEILFTQWNVLPQDVQIGHTTRSLGWLATISWLAFCTYQSENTRAILLE